jgi:hypothetical protein
MGFYLHTLKLRAEARSEFKEKVKTSLADPALDIFEWDAIKNIVTWEEEGKEFWLKGQLYDVVAQKSIDGKKYIYCLNDAKEEQIVEQQLKITSNANSSGKNHKTLKFSLPNFILLSNKVKPVASNERLKFSFKEVKEHLQYYDPAFPPPRV